MKNPPSANRRRWVLTAIALATALTASLLLRARAPADAATVTAPAGAAPLAAPGAASSIQSLEFLAADLITVQPVALSRGVDFSGPLVAVRQAVARARIAGEIVELTVREGDVVKAGQVIGRIDATEATARLKERQALLASAQAQLDAANKTLSNNSDLFQKGFVSQAVVDTSTSNAQVARAQRDAALAQLQVAEKQLGDTRILAPVSGQVAERMAQQGDRVAPDTRIVSVVDTSALEIQAALPAADVGRLQPGQPADLRIEGLDRNRTGRVSRIAPAALGGSRSVPVFIAVEGPDPQLRSGLFARGRIAIGSGQPVLAIPQTALRDQSGRQVVYRISTDNRVEAVAVETGGLGLGGARQETWIEITAGLQAGDRVVGPNLGPLRDGAAVRIVDAKHP